MTNTKVKFWHNIPLNINTMKTLDQPATIDVRTLNVVPSFKGSAWKAGRLERRPAYQALPLNYNWSIHLQLLGGEAQRVNIM